MQNTSRQYQQLQPEERVTLASLAQQKLSVRGMAQVLNRSWFVAMDRAARASCRIYLRERGDAIRFVTMLSGIAQ